MRTSASQLEVMVEFMERNGDLSKPTQGPQGRIQNINKWQELATALNSDGTGDKKSAEKWRKVWSDYKNNTKRKAARYQKAAVGTGGGPALKIRLTDLELRTLNIVGPQAAFGLAEVEEVGLNQDSPSFEVLIERLPGIATVTQDSNVELSSPDWSQPSTSGVVPMREPVDTELASPAQETQHLLQELPASPVQSLPAYLPRHQPTSPPAQPPTRPSAAHISPRQRRPTARRILTASSPRQLRTTRPATQAEMARMEFARADAKWRAFQREKEMNRREEERERLRLKDIELQQQAKWHELFQQLILLAREVANKLIKD